MVAPKGIVACMDKGPAKKEELVVTCGEKGQLKLWNCTSGECVATEKEQLVPVGYQQLQYVSRPPTPFLLLSWSRQWHSVLTLPLLLCLILSTVRSISPSLSFFSCTVWLYLPSFLYCGFLSCTMFLFPSLSLSLSLSHCDTC